MLIAMKKLWITLFVLPCVFWLGCEINGNFSVANITLNTWPASKNIAINTPEEIQRAQIILEQPFKYLGQGRQSFIFKSQDDQYILKFMKCQRMNVATWYENIWLPSFLDSRRRLEITDKKMRFKSLARSMSLAKKPLQQQTGVLFLHVEPTHEIQKNVQLFDRLGFSYSIDINNCPFVLQKRAQGAFETLKALFKENKREELVCRLHQLIDLLKERAQCGIINPDGKLIRHNNVGFLETRAIYIDLGTLKRSKKSTKPRHIIKDFARLDPVLKWLQAKDAELAYDFSCHIEQAIESISQE